MSPCSSGFPEIHYEDQAGHKLVVMLPALPLICWDHTPVPLFPEKFLKHLGIKPRALRRPGIITTEL